MNQTIKKNLRRVLNVLFIPLVAFILSIKLQEFFSINLLLIVAASVYLLKSRFLDNLPPSYLQLNALDIAVHVVVLIELIDYLGSTYRPNSFYSLSEVVFLLLFYHLVRFNLQTEYQRISLFLFLTLWAIFLSGVGFLYFYRLLSRLREIGLTDITNFRYRIYVLNPIGLSIGEWVTVLLTILPFPIICFVRFRRSLIARIFFGLVIVALVTITLMTFIRGVYIAVAGFFLLGTFLFYWYRVFPLRRILAFDALIVALTALALIPVAKPALTTLSMLKTTSQVRSFEGRQSIWRNSLKLVKEHPWLGTGQNNFSMQYVSFKPPEEESGIALRPFNYFLQILVERGILGVAAYSFLIISFFLISHRKLRILGDDPYRKSIVILLMVAYAAAMVRDLSESSIFINRGLQTLLWFMFALNAQPWNSEGEKSKP